MVLPITYRAHETSTNPADGTGSFYRFRARSFQPPPYSEPTVFRRILVDTYYADRSANVTFGGFANANTGKAGPRAEIYAWQSGVFAGPDFLAVLAKARGVFVDKMSASAEVAVNWAERKQSMAMVTTRLGQLLRFTRKIIRFDLVGAGRELGLGNPHAAKRRVERSLKVKKKAKTVSNLWLEYHFGWEPLVKDIGSAIEFFQQPINDCPVEGYAKRLFVDDRKWGTADSGGICTGLGTHHTSYRVKIGASYRINNPNLFLANRMGMTNPLTVAWELVPFSFVVDWFVNVSDFLGQFSDLHGVTLVKPWYSRKWYDFCQGSERQTYFGNPVTIYSDPANNYYMSVISCARDAARTLGFPGITLGIRPPWILSPTRAATVAALLVQKLVR